MLTFNPMGAPPRMPQPMFSDEPPEVPAPHAPNRAILAVVPDRLSRAEVLETMARVAPAIGRCAWGEHGVATASIVAGHDGAVIRASVRGAFTRPAVLCMENLLQSIRFPAFTVGTLSLEYPFSIAGN